MLYNHIGMMKRGKQMGRRMLNSFLIYLFIY